MVILSHHREFLEFLASVRDKGVDMNQQSPVVYKPLHYPNLYI